MIKESK